MTLTLSGRTRVAGVVGRPVEHSLSPLIHNAWLGACEVDAAYLAFGPARDRFAAFVEGVRGGVLVGVNVTAPFKEEALRLADEASEEARRAGASNLLIFDAGGGVTAHNTDGAGLLFALATQAPGLNLAAARVVVLGAGGAARGAVAALRDAKVEGIAVVNRTAAKARALANDFPGTDVFDPEDAERACAGAALVINASSAPAGEGLSLDRVFRSLLPGAAALDMTYRPLKTAFLRAAEAAGLTPVDGLQMLIGQAVPAFRLLFGAEPPSLSDVRGLALQALADAP